jgi:hypothetical protein
MTMKWKGENCLSVAADLGTGEQGEREDASLRVCTKEKVQPSRENGVTRRRTIPAQTSVEKVELNVMK